MNLAASSSTVPRLVVLGQAGSTNEEFAHRLHDVSHTEWPEFSTLVTDHQTAGRGRLGRSWTAPAGTMLATSVLLRPARAGILGAEAKGWIPLLAGLAMTRALTSLHVPAELKWPNDVMIGGGKVCGILVDAHPGDAVIVGAGVNLAMTVDQLPVPTATSMLIAGTETDPDVVLAAYLANLRELYTEFARSRGDAERSGLHAAVAEACSTLGRQVRVQVPGDEELLGVAVELDGMGHLVVESDGQRTTVAAGDVTHLRY